MALFRRFFYRKPPDRLLEISERVYVFDCCFSSDVLDEDEYKVYLGGIVSQLQDHYSDASYMVFNFKEGEKRSQISDILSQYDMTIMDYPRQHEGCPLLPLEMIHHFLRSSESWLSLEGQQNVLLMHCERGGWPMLAFILAGLLLYRKQYSGEQKTLEMVYKQAPKELLYLLSPLNPQPSQLRYLRYISRRNMSSDWPPSDTPLTLDCIMLKFLPTFDLGRGCRPVIRIYGQDPSRIANTTSKLIFSSANCRKRVPYYLKADCELVKLDIRCRFQGDVVLECIHLDENLVHEEMIFRVMFHTAFVRSSVLVLSSDEIDLLWNAKDQFPKDFGVEVLFSDTDPVFPMAITEVAGEDAIEVESALLECASPEEFFEVEEIFSSVVDGHGKASHYMETHIIQEHKLNGETNKEFFKEDSVSHTFQDCGPYDLKHKEDLMVDSLLNTVKEIILNDGIISNLSSMVMNAENLENVETNILNGKLEERESKSNTEVTAIQKLEDTLHVKSGAITTMKIVENELENGKTDILHGKLKEENKLNLEVTAAHKLETTLHGNSDAIATVSISENVLKNVETNSFYGKSEERENKPHIEVTAAQKLEFKILDENLSCDHSRQKSEKHPQSTLKKQVGSNANSVADPVAGKQRGKPQDPQDTTGKPAKTKPTISRWIPPHKGSYTSSMHITYPPTRYNSAPPILSLKREPNTGSSTKPHSVVSSASGKISKVNKTDQTDQIDHAVDPMEPSGIASEAVASISASLKSLAPLEVPQSGPQKVIVPPPLPPPCSNTSSSASTVQSCTIFPYLEEKPHIPPPPPPPLYFGFPSKHLTPPTHYDITSNTYSLSHASPSPSLLPHVCTSSSVSYQGAPPPPPPQPSVFSSTQNDGMVFPPPPPPPPWSSNPIAKSSTPSPPPPPPPPPCIYKPPPPHILGASLPPLPIYGAPSSSPHMFGDPPLPCPMYATPSLIDGTPPTTFGMPPPPPPPPPFRGGAPPSPTSSVPPPPSDPPLENGVPTPPPPFRIGSLHPPSPSSSVLPPPAFRVAAPPPPPPASSSGFPPPPPPFRGVPPPPSGGVPPPPPPPFRGGAPPPPPSPRGGGRVSLPPPPPPLGRPGGIVPGPLAGSPPPPPIASKGLISALDARGLPSGRGRGASRSLGVSTAQRKSSLKPLHWSKVTRALKGSLWEELQRFGDPQTAPDFDVLELETLFSTILPKSGDGPGGKSGGRRKSAGSKADKVHLVDLRRANNTEIMLTKVKMPLPDMMTAALAMDESVLDVDQIENLIKFCPTKDEMELLKGYTGDENNLGKCEQFFLELMKVPRVESKLRVFSFKIQFGSQISDFKKSLNTVNSACEEVRNSVKLKEVMKRILYLGNTLNQGTARGSAVGFKLDSLLKLTDTRASNSKMTLMHYLCKVLASKPSSGLLNFHLDLVSLEASSKIQLKSLAEEMQAIIKGLEKLKQELITSENDGPVSDVFRKTLKEFIGVAETEVASVANLYSVVGRNADAISLYFGEDPARCPFEQVTATLLNFVRMFRKAHDENCKQAELEKKKAEKEANMGKAKGLNLTKKLESAKNHEA